MSIFHTGGSWGVLGGRNKDARLGVEVRPARSASNRYFRNGLRRSTALTDVATVTRATTAWGVDQGGNVAAFAAGQPVVNTAGLAVYEARTNYVRNPTGLGAVVGTLGSGGALPTNWVQDVGTGLTWSVVGTGVENGLNYVDLRFAGTPSGTFLNVLFEGNTAISAATGGIWTASFSAKLVAGSLTNVSKAQVSIFERTSGGTYVAGGSVLDFMPGSTLKEYRAARTLNGGGTVACVNCAISLVYTSGAALDLTLRIAAPNLKKGADIGDPPILQTNNAAATRNADVISEAINIPPGQPFTVIWRGVAPAAAANFGRLVSLHDNVSTLRNYVILYLNPSASAVFVGLSSAGVTTANPNKGCTPGAPLAVVLSVAGDQITWSVNGSAASAHTLAGGRLDAALLLMALGYDPSTDARQLNSTIRDLQIVMRAYSAAECAAASDVTLTHDLDFVSQVYQYVGAPYVTPTDLPGTTFSRASAAWTENPATGRLTQASSGALRVLPGLGATFEASSYNLVTSPNDPNTSWAETGTSGSSAGLSADGAFTARTVASGGAGWHRRTCSIVAVTSGATYQVTTWYRAGTSGKIHIELRNATSTGGSVAEGPVGSPSAGDQSAGTVSNVVTTAYPDGRYKTTFQWVPNFTGVPLTSGVGPFSNTAGETVILEGFQVEQGSSPSSLTVGLRAADVLASANDNNLSAYTVAAEFMVPASGPAYGHVWTYDDGSGTNSRSFVYYDRAAGRLYAAVENGGVAQAVLNLGVATPGQTYKVAFAVAANDFAAIMTGGSVQVDGAGTVPSTSFFRFGQALGGANHFGSGIRRVQRFSTRKTNSELQAMVA